MQDVRTMAPHYETRVGKRRWNERMRTRGGSSEKKEDGTGTGAGNTSS